MNPARYPTGVRPAPPDRGIPTTVRRRAGHGPGPAALFMALLVGTLTGCVGDDEALTLPAVGEPGAVEAFAPTVDTAALGVALDDARTRVLPALTGDGNVARIDSAVRGLQAAVVNRDAATFARRLGEAETALLAVEGADDVILVEVAAVELAIRAARATLRGATISGESP